MIRCLNCMEEYDSSLGICPYCGSSNETIKPVRSYHMVPGTILHKRYTIGTALGFGGFGVTYIGYDNVLNCKVAIKEYMPSDCATRVPAQAEVTVYDGEKSVQFTTGKGKFVGEAQTLAKMQAANGVINIYNCFEENNTAYIVMEYHKGKTLKQYLKERNTVLPDGTVKEGTISIEDAKAIMLPVIEALKFVHEKSIVHRDIAPDNIYLCDDGQVKLLDFGASRFATASHSKSLSVILKQGYAPAEQYNSRGNQGPWTDVYSLAATIYKAVTGILPEDAMERTTKDDLKKPSKCGAKLKKSEENALMNALQIKVEDRTQDLDEFKKELYGEDKVILKKSTLKKADSGKWPLWAKICSGVSGFAAVLFIAVVLLWKYGTGGPGDIVVPAGMTRTPNAVNQTQYNAQSLIQSANLIFQIVDKQYSDIIPEDMVLSQSIKKGKIVDQQEAVEVIISGGRQIFTLSDIIGMTKEEAIQYLTGIGVNYEFAEEYSAAVKNTVIGQSQDANTQIRRLDTIKLTVSMGYDGYIDENAETEVPDFTNLSFEEASKIAEQYGFYIVKAGTKESDKIINTVLEQSPLPGEKAHQGDVISIIVSAGATVYYVPDVQYKDEDAAVNEMKSVGVAVNVVYEESKTVAKGKVISQSIAANTKVTTGMTVTITVSTGSKEIIVHPWSNWVEAIPNGVDWRNYDIEERVQYNYRDKAFTDGYTEMPGWTLYKTEKEKGEYGEWTSWSTSQPEAIDDREIEQKTQYAYSDYETVTQTDNSASPGSDWSLKSNTPFLLDSDYDQVNWTDWTTYPAYESDTRRVESKQQWSSTTRQWTTQKNNSSAPAGWAIDNSKTSVAYGSWSDWNEGSAPASSSTLEVQTEQRSRDVVVDTKTIYKYYAYQYVHTKGGTYHHYDYQQAYDQSKDKVVKKLTVEFDYPLTNVKAWYKGNTIPAYYLPGAKTDDGGYFLEGTYQQDVYGTENYTVYRTRTITTTYHFYTWPEWSSFGDTPVTATSEVQVQERTIYRYKDRPYHYTYVFERWTPYSAYSDTAVTESSTRQVRTQVIYKYRDKQDLSHFYYYMWGDWSDYSDEKIESSDSREVGKRSLYRYKQKDE